MKLTVEQEIFDSNGNLKLMPGETLLAKKKLPCWVYRKGFLLKKGPLPVTIFSSDIGFIHRTNQRIVCTTIVDEGIVRDHVCVEVTIDGVIGYKRSKFRLTLVCKERNDEKYFVKLAPRESANEFLKEFTKRLK